MKKNDLRNRAEKIQFLNNLKNGILKVDDILYPACEIWKKKITGFEKVFFGENFLTDAKLLTKDEMVNKLKAENKTVIKTHEQSIIVIF